jgi:hypothetical protein
MDCEVSNRSSEEESLFCGSNEAESDESNQAPLIRLINALEVKASFCSFLVALDAGRGSGMLKAVNLGSYQFSSSLVAWYYFTKAADWCSGLR